MAIFAVMLLRRLTGIITALGVLNLALAGSGLPCVSPPTHHAAGSMAAGDMTNCADQHPESQSSKSPRHHSAPAGDCCPAVHACSFAFAAGADRAIDTRALQFDAARPAGTIAVSAPSIPPDPPPPRA